MAKLKATTLIKRAIESAVANLSNSSIWVTRQEKGTESLENVCSGFDIDKVEDAMHEDFFVNLWIDTTDLEQSEVDEIFDGVMEELIPSSYYLGTKFPHISKKDPNKVSLAILSRS